MRTQAAGGVSRVDSQRRKLELNWFIPQLRKYRRGGEVLVASLILRLLTLANPLIIQQIIDKVIIAEPRHPLRAGHVVVAGVDLPRLAECSAHYLFSDTTNRIDIALGGE